MKVSDPEFKEGWRALFRAVPGLEREQAARDLAQVFIDLAGEYARDGEGTKAGVGTPTPNAALEGEELLFVSDLRALPFADGQHLVIQAFGMDSRRPHLGPVVMMATVSFPCGCIIRRWFKADTAEVEFVVRGEH